MFNELWQLTEKKEENPLENIRKFKTDEQETAFLIPDQIKILINNYQKSNNPNLLPIIKICLATGARWSEDEQFKGSQFHPHKITFIKTKGRKNRTIDIY